MLITWGAALLYEPDMQKQPGLRNRLIFKARRGRSMMFLHGELVWKYCSIQSWYLLSFVNEYLIVSSRYVPSKFCMWAKTCSILNTKSSYWKWSRNQVFWPYFSYFDWFSWVDVILWVTIENGEENCQKCFHMSCKS